MSGGSFDFVNRIDNWFDGNKYGSGFLDSYWTAPRIAWFSDGQICKPVFDTNTGIYGSESGMKVYDKPITSSQEFIDITDKQDELKDLIQAGKDIAEEIKTLSEEVEEGIQKLVDESVEKFQEASVKEESDTKKWTLLGDLPKGKIYIKNDSESKETRFDKIEGNIVSYETTQEDVEKVIKRMGDFKFSDDLTPEKELPPIIITKPKGAKITIQNVNAPHQKIIVQDVEDGTKHPIGADLFSCIMNSFEHVEVPKQEVEMGLEIPPIRSTNERISGITHKEYKTIDDIFEDIEEDYLGSGYTENEDFEEIDRHRSEINSRNERIEELKKKIVKKWLGSDKTKLNVYDSCPSLKPVINCKEVDNWIPCKENLPSLSDIVEVKSGYGTGDLIHYPRMQRIAGTTTQWKNLNKQFDHAYHLNINRTFWRPIKDSDTVKFDKEIEDLTGKSDTVKMFEQAFKHSLPSDNKVSNVIDPNLHPGLWENQYQTSKRDQNGGQNNEGDLVDNSTPEHNWISCKDLMPDRKKIVEVKITDKLTGYTKQVKRNIRFQQMHDTCNFQYIRGNAITDGYSFVRDMFWRPLQNESLEDCLPENLKFQIGDLVIGLYEDEEDKDIKKILVGEVTKIEYNLHTLKVEDGRVVMQNGRPVRNRFIPVSLTFECDGHTFYQEGTKVIRFTPEIKQKIQEILEA